MSYSYADRCNDEVGAEHIFHRDGFKIRPFDDFWVGEIIPILILNETMQVLASLECQKVGT